jgi:hypothetical protein
MRSNQKHRAGLGLAQLFECSTDQRDIRTAFVGMAKHLKSRPEPRACFDEAGGNRSTPGWALVRAGRACLDAAQAKGPDALAATRTEVEAYFDTLKATTLRGYDAVEGSAELVIVEFARESGEAQAAITRLAVERSPAAEAHAWKEVREVIPAAARVLQFGHGISRATRPLTATR